MTEKEIEKDRVTEIMELIINRGYIPVSGAQQKSITISNMQIKRIELLAELYGDSFSAACNLAIMLGLEKYERETIEGWQRRQFEKDMEDREDALSGHFQEMKKENVEEELPF